MTNKIKHTPTPWETSCNALEQFDICEKDGGNMIADLAQCDNQEANAAYIVKCVNHHEKLVEMVENFKTTCAWLGIKKECSEFADTLRKQYDEAQALLKQMEE